MACLGLQSDADVKPGGLGSLSDSKVADFVDTLMITHKSTRPAHPENHNQSAKLSAIEPTKTENATQESKHALNSR